MQVGTSDRFHYAVLIETASNQRTIFQTNRLRENIGASQLIYSVGTDFVQKAVKELEKGEADIVVSASGKAIILTRGEDIAKKIVQQVTLETLLQCPGVIARGAYVRIEEWTAKGLDEAIKKVHWAVNNVAARLPSPAARFARLPFVENCASSGYPAKAINGKAPNTPASSEIILARRMPEVVNTARDRIAFLTDRPLAKSLKQFEEASERGEIGDWIAIVHADGNGLGQVFLSFAEHIAANATADDYIVALRAFSKATDVWARTAAGKAIENTWRDIEKKIESGKGDEFYLPVAPVVLGGDDLTVICEGERAVRFAALYLSEFEKASHTALSGKLGDLIPKLKGKRVAASAGIAIVKPHFPFHRAYELAEQLTKTAKATKQKFGQTPCSALDFQVIFDTSGAELEPIRERMTVTGSGESLTMRPYVVTPLDHLKGASMDAFAWAERRHYSDGPRPLQAAIEAVLRTPSESSERDDPSHLPRSQAHALHEALYFGRAVADGRLAQIRHRYRIPWERLTAGESLFIPDGKEKGDDGEEQERFGAILLDAMELADLGREHALDKDAYTKWGRP
jgi:hypothetical protein